MNGTHKLVFSDREHWCNLVVHLEECTFLKSVHCSRLPCVILGSALMNGTHKLVFSDKEHLCNLVVRLEECTFAESVRFSLLPGAILRSALMNGTHKLVFFLTENTGVIWWCSWRSVHF